MVTRNDSFEMEASQWSVVGVGGTGSKSMLLSESICTRQYQEY